ncbi:hypothetical protein PSHT_15315 [Puccinia striiformis]|uniref:Uncharacterized protein n=3 Tax=Puccinia striiformis TaxID=27350 RepID=A0A0L0URC4_9BASI|nr:hypothetical protein PSTG_17222 [Puccinia striiformis f. sp. tritici PST-78]POV96121.1 hypothetical protein PSHT_15315 [Puccinia striiformis]POW13643.1 hypothetical protein PSTT_03602 [Puccinia striiformis]
MVHKYVGDYFVNLAAMPPPQARHRFSNITVVPIHPPRQLAGLRKGVVQWHAAGTKAGPPSEVETIDPALGLP